MKFKRLFLFLMLSLAGCDQTPAPMAVPVLPVPVTTTTASPEVVANYNLELLPIDYEFGASTNQDAAASRLLVANWLTSRPTDEIISIVPIPAKGGNQNHLTHLLIVSEPKRN